MDAELEGISPRESHQRRPSRSSSLFPAIQDLMAFPFRRRQATTPAAQPQPPLPPPPPLSVYSSPAVPDSGWAAGNFMLGAGMVIIQPSTQKLVVIYDSKSKQWFLPRGRKDIGETLEAAALREAYEESGYQVDFLPLHTPSHAPAPPNDPTARRRPNTEPVYLTLTAWAPGSGNRKSGGEYLTSWYVGQIPEDAVYTQGTGMPDEQTYTSHLATYDDAMTLLYRTECDVLRYAWVAYQQTLQIQEEEMRREVREKHRSSNSTAPTETQEQLTTNRRSPH